MVVVESNTLARQNSTKFRGNNTELVQKQKKIKNQGKRRTRVDGEGAKELKEPI